jgi:predicted O-methyltransferase YrrM
MRLYQTLPTISQEKQNRFAPKQGIEVEPEFGALLYGLVRLGKPAICVETGTYIGESAEWIARGLRDNGSGTLITCDTDWEHVLSSCQRLKDLPVEVIQRDGCELLKACTMMDFVHLDGGDPAMRLEQLKLIGNHNISPGGIVAWHDAVVWCADMYDYFTSVCDWPHLILPTPVGVAVFQKPL